MAERAQKGGAGGEERGKGFTRRKGTGSHAALVIILRSFFTTFWCPPVCVHTRAHTRVCARARTHTHTYMHTHMTEEWERMMEDIKDYPDPNVKIATVDVG